MNVNMMNGKTFGFNFNCKCERKLDTVYALLIFGSKNVLSSICSEGKTYS